MWPLVFTLAVDTQGHAVVPPSPTRERSNNSNRPSDKVASRFVSDLGVFKQLIFGCVSLFVWPLMVNIVVGDLSFSLLHPFMNALLWPLMAYVVLRRTFSLLDPLTYTLVFFHLNSCQILG